MTTAYEMVVKGKVASLYDIVNVFHFVKGVDTEDSELEDLCADWIDGMWTPIAPYLSAAYSIHSFGLRKYVDGVWGLESVHSISIAGSDSSEMLPLQNAAVALTRTGIKRVFGRKFIGPLTITSISSTELASAALIAMASFTAKWIAGQDGIGAGHNIRPRIYRKDTGQFEALLGGAVDVLVGSMRRRKVGVGS